MPAIIQFPAEEADQSHIRRAPLHSSGTADDIAHTVLFLCPLAEFTNAWVFVVDGGYSVT